MAFSFPNAPSIGQQVSTGGHLYQWDGSIWGRVTGSGTIVVSDVAPTNAKAGDLWLRSTDSLLFAYVNDGDSSQWIQVNGASTATGASEDTAFAHALIMSSLRG